MMIGAANAVRTPPPHSLTPCPLVHFRPFLCLAVFVMTKQTAAIWKVNRRPEAQVVLGVLQMVLGFFPLPQFVL